MRFRRYYCQDESVGRLLSEFKESQDPLYHYTDRVASEGISGGELWMTRADCFLDSREIEHGLETLSAAARTTLRGAESVSFSDVLGAVSARLRTCFVLSLSQDPESDYLRSKYAKNGGIVLEFEESFPRVLYTGWHAFPKGHDCSGLHYVVNNYDFFEGFVVYDDSHKRRLATISCQAFRDLLYSEAHVVDTYHFVDILMQCLLLFKRQEFKVEAEYRVALVRKPGVRKSFEQTRGPAGRNQAYIKVRIPSARAAEILARDL